MNTSPEKSLTVDDLDYPYPEDLVATERADQSRILLADLARPAPVELPSRRDLLNLFSPGDCLVINETRVLKRRVFTESSLEILFLDSVDGKEREWSVLCPSSRWKAGTDQILPEGVRLTLAERGRIQKVEASAPLTPAYFERNGDLPLPPYIQKARGERRNRQADSDDYQTAWAKNGGSLAAPTASLHFSNDDLHTLGSRGVKIIKITLHVGLGTFLPITVQNLDEHRMHAEPVEIPRAAWDEIRLAKANGTKVWALGTTVIRSLEAAAIGLIPETDSGFYGSTDVFITPGFEFKVVDRILTNFHQPRSTLIALVAAFAGLEKVKSTYAWAIEHKFRLFSYGDLSVWIK